ncbi:MAG: c-type cytochrome biogenesis protein CcmI [Gammaproteobacteria bacterium]|nr:c-type cytochrome biogenesis protein CcmI [Gammaproteobacteria bacterium]MDH5731344.1 c-type cytochrome biogenesis protein CcmI [Gammaproteobacteria bacterium]
MLVGFWLIAILFVIGALAFLLPPLLRKQVASNKINQKDLTVSIYQDQFAELENDLKNGVISQDQFEQAKVDAERNLLDDMSKLDADEKVEASNVKLNKAAAIVIALFIPVSAVSLYGYWGAGKAGLDPENASPQVSAEQHNEQSVESMVDQLLVRLEQDPNDGQGWYMLARTYQFLKRYGDAVKAYEKVVVLGGGQDPDVLSSYADAVAMAGGRVLNERAIGLLQQAIAVDPQHVKSLWLLGTAAYQNEKYETALQHWENLFAVLPGGDDKEQIAKNLAEVRTRLGLPVDIEKLKAESRQGLGMNPPMAQAGASQSTQAAAMSDARISGNVTLGGAVASKANPNDTVFVFARAAQGPRMPLAIVKKQVKDLPFDFTLDDSMAMNPQMRLSSFAKVVVGARISKSGNAMPQPGDLQTLSSPMNVADAPSVKLVINQVVN